MAKTVTSTVPETADPEVTPVGETPTTEAPAPEVTPVDETPTTEAPAPEETQVGESPVADAPAADAFIEQVKERAREVFSMHSEDEIFFTSDGTAFIEPQHAQMHATFLVNGTVHPVKRSEVE